MPAGNSLARHYRRLLWCYPPEYRRTRGDEIVDTLLDGAAGRARPSAREVVNLSANGMRCRLGRPPNLVGPPGARPIENTTTYLVVTLQRTAPFAVYPAAVLSGLVGVMIGWIVFGWASRKAERRRKSVKAPYIVTMVLWWLPVLLATPNAIIVHRYFPHSPLGPIWEWLGQPVLSLFFLAGCASALAALVNAALPRQIHDVATEMPDLNAARPAERAGARAG
jgi:hypothetical protein